MNLKYLILPVIPLILYACNSAIPTPEAARAWTPHEKTDSIYSCDFDSTRGPVLLSISRIGADYVKAQSKIFLTNWSDTPYTLLVSARINATEGKRKIADGQKVVTLQPGSQSVLIDLNTIYVPPLWTTDTPSTLPFKVTLSLPHDEVINTWESRVGLRWTSVTHTTGFTLNGLPKPLRGVAWSLSHNPETRTPEEDLRDIQRIHDMGANLILFTTPPNHYQLALCDHFGLFAMVNFNATATYKIVRMTQSQILNYLDTAYNHPSVIAFGAGYDGNAYDNLNVSENIQWIRKNAPMSLVFAGIRDNAKLMRETDMILYNVSATGIDSECSQLQKLQEAGVRMPVISWMQPNTTDLPLSQRALDLITPLSVGVVVGTLADSGTEFNFALTHPESGEPSELFYFLAARWSSKPILKIASQIEHRDANEKWIHVHSNFKRIELFVNGESLGEVLPPFGGWKIPNTVQAPYNVEVKGIDAEGHHASDACILNGDA